MLSLELMKVAKENGYELFKRIYNFVSFFTVIKYYPTAFE